MTTVEVTKSSTHTAFGSAWDVTFTDSAHAPQDVLAVPRVLEQPAEHLAHNLLVRERRGRPRRANRHVDALPGEGAVRVEQLEDQRVMVAKNRNPQASRLTAAYTGAGISVPLICGCNRD